MKIVPNVQQPRDASALLGELTAAINRASHQRDVFQSTDLFLQSTIEMAGALNGFLFRLRLTSGNFELRDRTAGAVQNQKRRPLVQVPHDLAGEQLKARLKFLLGVDSTHDLAVHPIRRERAHIGLLVLEFRGTAELDRSVVLALAASCAVLVHHFEKESSFELLNEVQQPVDFLLPIDEFLQKILTVIHKASAMPRIAIREYDESAASLKCIAHYGFEQKEKSDLDLSPADKYPVFFEALIDGKTIAEPDMDAPHLSALKHKFGEIDEKIKSFVVAPIKVGSAVFGTLSFAALITYEYTELEMTGFESIANSIGNAISNSRNAHQLAQLSLEDARLAGITTAVEIAQQARHDARAAVDDIAVNISTLRRQVRTIKGTADIQAIVDDFDQQLDRVRVAMDNIRNATDKSDDTPQLVSVHDVWGQAKALVSSKLSKERIEVRPHGKDVTIEAFPVALRHAFLHLLLNSIDAFPNGRRNGRQISFSIEPVASPTAVKMKYSDNASGIDPNKFQRFLKAGESLKEANVASLIFEKGVTSKDKGSGYGLYLVRKILDRHNGSIDLTSYRGGVTFEIVLGKSTAVSDPSR